MKIYSIKDLKSGFGKPYYAVDNGLAVREFSRSCNCEPSFNKELLVKDLELYYIGDFDDTNGHITPVDPVMLCRGIDCLLDETKISVEDINAEYEKIMSIFTSMASSISDKIKNIDSLIVSKVASLSDNLSKQNKIKRILRGK